MEQGKLLEDGCVWHDGKRTERRFRWDGDGDVRGWKIEARLRAESVRVFRRLESGIDLGREELAAVALASRHWLASRSQWAAFRHTESGHFKAMAGRWNYQPPGRDAEFTTIWRWPQDPVADQITGDDREVPLDAEVAIAPGVTRVATLLRIGERVGPPEGSPIGHVYRIGARIRLVTRRHSSHLEAGRETLEIAAAEVPFLQQLALVGEA